MAFKDAEDIEDYLGETAQFIQRKYRDWRYGDKVRKKQEEIEKRRRDRQRAIDDARATRSGYGNYKTPAQDEDEDENTRFWRENDARHKDLPEDDRTYETQSYEGETIPGRGEKGGPRNEYEYDQERMYGDDMIQSYSNKELEDMEEEGEWSQYKNDKYDYYRNGAQKKPTAQEVADAVDVPTSDPNEKNIPLGASNKKKSGAGSSTGKNKGKGYNEKDLVYQRYQKATGNKWKDVKKDKRFADVYNGGDYDGNMAVGRRADRMIRGEYADQEDVKNHSKNRVSETPREMPGDLSDINIPSGGISPIDKRSLGDRTASLKKKIRQRRADRAQRKADRLRE